MTQQEKTSNPAHQTQMMGSTCHPYKRYDEHPDGGGMREDELGAYVRFEVVEQLSGRIAKLEDDMCLALLDVLEERHRQVSSEGWTPEHDDQHDDYSLAKAASVYAACASVDRPDRAVMDQFGLAGTPTAIIRNWPTTWDTSWLKPTNRRRDLVKAVALLIAEIERLDRIMFREAESMSDRTYWTGSEDEQEPLDVK
ncbi:hypothetical protein [Aliirhizobium cellulosilyticum]|uniref:Uncharacterized protein n=1 Tax=Aliirhizobium cellulosilyticum TaxID=393664 RepID=A0A7W6XZ51_9HYPH|nr:hypothetical protein [Rhizobium cellulosilyticum]MBB4348001.1 hypothetical protein [Rhizobium cellulosilyticum]MBB4409605.1 hypothetical protein [Rhizobium cellulosilyticum]MBB4444293.1 hypothetical protein [Rhizobium cellulosilyticum]